MDRKITLTIKTSTAVASVSDHYNIYKGADFHTTPVPHSIHMSASAVAEVCSFKSVVSRLKCGRVLAAFCKAASTFGTSTKSHSTKDSSSHTSFFGHADLAFMISIYSISVHDETLWWQVT